MPNDNQRKSKYIREPGEKPTSKYIRQKDDVRSKYIKRQGADKYFEQRFEEPEELNEKQLEAAENAQAEAQTDVETTDINEVVKEEEKKEEEKKTSSGVTIGVEEKPHSLANQQEDYIKQTTIRMFLSLGILTVLAVALQIFNVRIPFMPTRVTVEFSAIPELIATIAFGPIYGVAVVVLKNLFHLIIIHNSFVTEVSNVISDSAFVLLAGAIYSNDMFGPKAYQAVRRNPKKDRRRGVIIKAGGIGTIAIAVVVYFVTTYFTYPYLFKHYAGAGYTAANFIDSYQIAINSLLSFLHIPLNITIQRIEQTVLIYVVPATIIKYFAVTVFTSLIYKYISPFLHNRKKSKKKKNK